MGGLYKGSRDIEGYLPQDLEFIADVQTLKGAAILLTSSTTIILDIAIAIASAIDIAIVVLVLLLLLSGQRPPTGS